MQHHQFELISGVYLVYMHLQCISGVYACFWLYINFGPKLAYIEQLLSSIIMLANLKPIYLHYLYLNMDLYKVYLDVVPAVYAAQL